MTGSNLENVDKKESLSQADVDQLGLLPPELIVKIFDSLPLTQIVRFLLVNKKLAEVALDYLRREIKVKQVACGFDFTLILLTNGRVVGMGNNALGQLGLDELENVSSPTELPGLDKIKSIHVGNYHTILRSQQDELWVMGSNTYGQIHPDKSIQYIKTPQKMSCATKVSSLLTDNALTVVYDSTECVTYGDFSKLEVFQFPKGLRVLPERFYLPSDLIIDDISMVQNHALLLTDEGDVWAYGGNDQGQLGFDKSWDFIAEWTQLPNIKAQEIKTTCTGSFILTNTNKLLACGKITEFQQDIIQEEIIDGFKTIATDCVSFDAHDHHVLYVLSSGKVYAFGTNTHGQLGIVKEKPQVIDLFGEIQDLEYSRRGVDEPSLFDDLINFDFGYKLIEKKYSPTLLQGFFKFQQPVENKPTFFSLSEDVWDMDENLETDVARFTY